MLPFVLVLNIYCNAQDENDDVEQPTRHAKPGPDSKVWFNVQVMGVVYFDFNNVLHITNPNGYKLLSLTTERNLQYGGMHVELGPEFSKRVHLNFATGFEANNLEANNYLVGIPAYADFNFNLMVSRFASSVHVGGGILRPGCQRVAGYFWRRPVCVGRRA